MGRKDILMRKILVLTDMDSNGSGYQFICSNLFDEVAKLAKGHVQYGVKAEHYSIVGEALLWTLEKGLAEHWTEEVKEAWVLCYTTLANAMIAAADEVQAAA